MSTYLGRAGRVTTGCHWIDVAKSSAEVHAQSLPLVEADVGWPHMWKPGQRAYVTLSDGQEWVGAVLSVSRHTRKVLIELL